MIPPRSRTSSGPAPAARCWPAVVPATNCSRRSWSARLRGRALLCAAALAASIVTTSALVASRLTRNYTPSLPLGVYWLRPGLPVSKGALVDFPIPSNARQLIAGRYLPARFHLLKRVVALEGDVVCLARGQYVVNGVSISAIATRDSIGRSLPMLGFCGPVPAGNAFVATPVASSLDSRYFGPVPISAVTVASPLWTS